MKRLKCCVALLLSLIFGLSGALQPFTLYAETLDLAQEQPKVSQPANESGSSNVSADASGDQVESDSAAQDPSTPDSSEAADAESASADAATDEVSDEASDDDIEAPLAENSWRYVDGSLRSDLPDDYGANADFEGRAMHSMPKGATAQGIDVSEHNGTIDWQSVKDAGIDFAILRVGFAGDTSGGRLDYYFKRNVSECERLGIPYGVYLYSYARNEDEARAEARLMLSALKGHSPTLPVYYDLEERETNADGSPKWTPFNDPSKLASIAKTFCGQIAAAGYKPGIYANVNWFKNYLTDPCFLSSGWSIWTAQYWYGGRYDECLGLTPDAPAKYDCWQYSARGSVPGVSGDVDVSYWFGEGLCDHWQETDEGKYYVSPTGQRYTGWKLISGVWYWFDPVKGGAMATGLHECNGSMYYFRSSGDMATGWVLDGGTWYYAGGSGALASGWLHLGSVWYWLDPAKGGAMATGPAEVEGTWYVFSSSGSLSSGWVRNDGEWYYGDSGGKMVRGWVRGSAWYYTDPESGRMLTGAVEIDGKSYWLDPANGGACARSAWVETQGGVLSFAADDGVLYMAVKDGVVYKDATFTEVLSGWVDCGGDRFYIDSQGHLLTGWQRIDENWYLLDSNGIMHRGWYWNGSAYYYLDKSNGNMRTGWVLDLGSWYWLDPDSGGAMATGWKKVGQNWYYLNPNNGGRMVTGSLMIDGYIRTFNSDGSCIYWGYQNPSNYYQVSSKSVAIPHLGQGIFGYRTESRISVSATRNECVNAMITRAYDYVGTTPYIWDYSCAPGVGIDCAGLVMQCLYATGMDLGRYTPWDHYYTPGHDHYANDMWNDPKFMHLDFSQRQRGDLICYNGHIAIYLGNDQIIEAASPRYGVRVHSVYVGYPIKGVLRPFV